MKNELVMDNRPAARGSRIATLAIVTVGLSLVIASSATATTQVNFSLNTTHPGHPCGDGIIQTDCGLGCTWNPDTGEWDCQSDCPVAILYSVLRQCVLD